MNIEVRTLPVRHVAYVANMQGYKTEKIKHAWAVLCRWANAHELLNKNSLILGMFPKWLELCFQSGIS